MACLHIMASFIPYYAVLVCLHPSKVLSCLHARFVVPACLVTERGFEAPLTSQDLIKQSMCLILVAVQQDTFQQGPCDEQGG